MNATMPTKSTRDWLAKHAEHVAHFKKLAKANGVRFRRHSKAFELGATATLSQVKRAGE